MALAAPIMVEERVGILRTDSGDSCVGTLIGDEVVLTAAHCLFDAKQQPVEPKKITYHRGGYNPIRGSTILSHPKFSPKQSTSIESIEFDIAVVYLEHPAGIISTIPVGDLVNSGDAVRVLRYDSKRSLKCEIVDMTSAVFTLDCVITAGDSGAPVITANDAGDFCILGVISAYETAGKSHTAIATSLDNFFKKLISSMK